MDHPWPGNVRELENIIARAVLINPSREIDPDTLFPAPLAQGEIPASLHQTVKGFSWTTALQNTQDLTDLLSTMFA